MAVRSPAKRETRKRCCFWPSRSAAVLEGIGPAGGRALVAARGASAAAPQLTHAPFTTVSSASRVQSPPLSILSRRAMPTRSCSRPSTRAPSTAPWSPVTGTRPRSRRRACTRPSPARPAHSAAAAWLASGLPMMYVQRQLGHTDIGTTIHNYGHLEESFLLDAGERAEVAMFGHTRPE